MRPSVARTPAQQQGLASDRVIGGPGLLRSRLTSTPTVLETIVTALIPTVRTTPGP